MEKTRARSSRSPGLMVLREHCPGWKGYSEVSKYSTLPLDPLHLLFLDKIAFYMQGRYESRMSIINWWLEQGTGRGMCMFLPLRIIKTSTSSVYTVSTSRVTRVASDIFKILSKYLWWEWMNPIPPGISLHFLEFFKEFKIQSVPPWTRNLTIDFICFFTI